MKTTTLTYDGRGYLCYLETDDQMIVAWLHVKPDWRKRGIASDLLFRLKRAADSAQKPVLLRAIPSGGGYTLKTLMQFYMNRGFEPDEKRFGEGAMIYFPKPQERLQSIAT